MFVTSRPILTLALLLTAAAWSASLNAQCLYYGDASLSGRLVQQTYPGPPDFESFQRGDEPRVIWILQLDPSVCIISSDASYPNAYGLREIQVVLGEDQYARTEPYARYRNLLGQQIIVTGSLLPGGARYEKRWVLAIDAIEKVRR